MRSRVDTGAGEEGTPLNWNLVRIGDVSTIGTGGTPDTSRPEFYEPGTVRWLKSGDIEGPYITEVPNQISDDGLAHSNATVYSIGTVMIALSGQGKTRGKTAVLQVPSACSQSVAAITPNPEILSSEFLHYNLSSRYGEIRDITGNNDRSGLNLRIIKSIPIRLPPLDEQNKIASILLQVDGAISKTNEIVAETRRLKKGITHQLLTSGSRQNEFKQSSLGPIPKDWQVFPLRSLLAEPIKNGYSPTSSPHPTGKWVLTLSALSQDGIRSDRCKPAPLNNPDVDRTKLTSGDLLVSRSNTRNLVGLASLYKGEPTDASYPDLMMRVRVDSNAIDNRFLEAWLNHPLSKRYLSSKAAGTSASMVKITKSILEALEVPVPDLAEQREIVSKIQVVNNKLALEKGKLESLYRLRTGLMQDLLSGRVQVKVN